MSDHNLIDDPLVSFDQQQQQPSPTKGKDSYDNRLLEDNDPFGNHNGTNGDKTHGVNEFSLNNELFPTDPDENDKGRRKKTFENKYSLDYYSIFNT